MHSSLFFNLVLLFITLLFVPNSYAQNSSLEQFIEGSDAPEEAPPNPTLKNTAGLFFGHVLYIREGKFIYVLPTDPEYSRKTFYFDRKTRISKYIDGRRRRAKAPELVEGQKVAVRYFNGETLAVADEVFLVNGEFLPSKYGKAKAKRKKKTPEPKEES